ncbi:MAG: kinase [Ghiorsea sp.]|nr:kinase [Ghiorsea sp.]
MNAKPDGLMMLSKELVAWIDAQKQADATLIIGISGAQGTGKSTLARQLKVLLRNRYSVALLSLDDLYLNQNKRKTLAASIHPLFAARGVPTTHNVNLGIQILKQLKGGQGELLLPRFDKQTDNPKPQHDWERCKTPVDIVLFEGWCLSLTPQSDDALLKPINKLEAEEDKQGIWRKQVNDALTADYQQLFQMIDKTIYLKAPSFESVFAWRKQQEVETFAQKTSLGMNDKALRRFMAHYERLTRHGFATMPQAADVLLILGEQHQCLKVYYKN